MTAGFLLNDNFHIVYLDNVIFHRLQRRLIGSELGLWVKTATKIPDFQPIFNIILLLPTYVCLRGSAPDPAGGLAAPPDPQLGNVGSHPCRGPRRIAGPRAPKPHNPPLMVGQNKSLGQWRKASMPLHFNRISFQEGHFRVKPSGNLRKLQVDMVANLETKSFQVCDSRAVEKFLGLWHISFNVVFPQIDKQDKKERTCNEYTAFSRDNINLQYSSPLLIFGSDVFRVLAVSLWRLRQ